MRNLLALIGLLVVGFAAVGWYCGWYKLSVTRGTEGNLQIQTEVDTNKVSNDSTTFFKKVGDMIGEKSDKSGQQPAATPVNMPGPASSPAAPAVSQPGTDANVPTTGNPPGWLGIPLKAPTAPRGQP